MDGQDAEFDRTGRDCVWKEDHTAFAQTSEKEI